MSTTITNLPETSKVNGSDYLVLDQSDKTVKSTVSNFLTDTGVVLATQLKDTDGADSINTSDGDSVQVHLDAIESAAQATTNLIKETNSVIPPDYSRQLIIGVTDRAGEASAEIRADAGKGEASPIPQCIATDPVTGEFFITRGWDATSPVYVHIYDRNFNFLKVVRAGGGWGEGEYGEEGFIPDMVDYSKLVPLLFAAIMQLKVKLDECESK